MTCVYITIDTEYSSGLAAGFCPVDRAENFARSVACLTPDGPAGITHKLALFEQYGIKAVFFVDPMPALIWGVAAIEDIVAPILNAGQDVQLHCHTEWLELARADNPLPGKRTGKNLYEFALEEQQQILEYARDTLVAAGAPAPVAFRAGNYGADDNTLRALGQLGLQYDISRFRSSGALCSTPISAMTRNSRGFLPEPCCNSKRSNGSLPRNALPISTSPRGKGRTRRCSAPTTRTAPASCCSIQRSPTAHCSARATRSTAR